MPWGLCHFPSQYRAVLWFGVCLGELELQCLHWWYVSRSPSKIFHVKKTYHTLTVEANEFVNDTSLLEQTCIVYTYIQLSHIMSRKVQGYSACVKMADVYP